MIIRSARPPRAITVSGFILAIIAVLSTSACSESEVASNPALPVTSASLPALPATWYKLSANQVCLRFGPLVGQSDLGAPLLGPPSPDSPGGGMRGCRIETALVPSPDGSAQWASAYSLYVNDTQTTYYATQVLPQIRLEESLATSKTEPAECGKGSVRFSEIRRGYEVVGIFCKSDKQMLISADAWLVNGEDSLQLTLNRPLWLEPILEAQTFSRMIDRVLATPYAVDHATTAER